MGAPSTDGSTRRLSFISIARQGETGSTPGRVAITACGVVTGPSPMADATALTTVITELQEQLRTTARLYCAALAELEPIAARLADLEGRLCAARHQAGTYHDPRPPARELAADIAHGHLQGLRPYVAVVTREATRRAEDSLVSPAMDTARGSAEAAPREQ